MILQGLTVGADGLVADEAARAAGGGAADGSSGCAGGGKGLEAWTRQQHNNVCSTSRWTVNCSTGGRHLGGSYVGPQGRKKGVRSWGGFQCGHGKRRGSFKADKCASDASKEGGMEEDMAICMHAGWPGRVGIHGARGRRCGRGMGVGNGRRM